MMVAFSGKNSLIPLASRLILCSRKVDARSAGSEHWHPEKVRDSPYRESKREITTMRCSWSTLGLVSN